MTLNNGKNNINYNDFPTPDIGQVRRENLALELFHKEGYVPRTISYRDIDGAFKRWVENDLDIDNEGEKLPTMFLVANQRLNEFGQAWKFTKEGGLLLNFKTITRETNPEKGTQQGGNYNIPIDKAIFEVVRIPVIENGIESYDVIKMKQPLQVDLTYTISIFSTNFPLLNEFNRMMQDKFKAIECYLNVNGHYISMELENTSDNSQYDLENRKFFSQSFQILVKAYIIREEDFIRERLQTRFVLSIDTESRDKPIVTIEEDETNTTQTINLNVNFQPFARPVAKFRLDENILVKSVRTVNIKSFKMRRDNEDFNVSTCNHFKLSKFERISITAQIENNGKEARIEFRGESF